MSNKTRTITLSKQDIFFDIDKLSLSYSEREDDVVKADHIAAETASKSGRRIITRMCDHRFADILYAVEKFIAPANETSASNAFNDSDYTITLSITEEAPDNILSTIADQAHQYIVCGSLADYYAQIGVQGNRESLQMRADAALKSIRELIYFRPMP